MVFNIRNESFNRSDPINPVDCLITAAGLSSRMGDWKMMLPMGGAGETILDRSIANALCFCHRILLVTGHRAEEVQQRYEHHPRIVLVKNSRFHLGLFSSIQAGIEACETDYLFVTHGDMPFISSDIFATLWRQRGEYAVFPVNGQGNQQGGHPVLLHRSLFKTILAAAPDSRIKALLMNQPHRFVSVCSDAIHTDIDTPKCYRQHCISSH